ncbi:MAG: hypothetical protein HUJ53_04985 [Holdemanella sp.]|nr:hypothetical protein [Holdemanella sp.]
MRKIIVCLFSILLFGCTAQKKETILYCVGDSITYGYNLNSEDAYPSILASFDESYTVYNGGINGITVSQYLYTDQYEKSKEIQADIIIIKLGTNDSLHYPGIKRFKEDYLKLIDTYKDKRIILCTPIQIYIENIDEIQKNLLEIVECIKEIGKERNLEVIDFYELSKNHKEWYQPDLLHPNKEGTRQIANSIYETIK